MGCEQSKEPGVIANPKQHGGSVNAAKATKDQSGKTLKQESTSSCEAEETDNPAATVKKTKKTSDRPGMPPKRPSLLALEGGYNHNNSFYAKAHLVDSEMGKKFKEVYTLGDKLGAGAFSTVREGIKKDYDPTKIDPQLDNPASYAIKIVRKENLTPLDEGALMDEIEILKEVGMYKHIIRLYDVFEEKKFYYMVTEKMCGGELYDRIIMKEKYNENEARNVSETLIAALGYCHSRRVAHRDLKPANLLMTDPEDDASIKIADFGFAKRVRKPKSLSTKCGTVRSERIFHRRSQHELTTVRWMECILHRTAFLSHHPLHHHYHSLNLFFFFTYTPVLLHIRSFGIPQPQYVAPEVLAGKLYDTQADMWSIGIIIFTLLAGHPPFENDNLKALVKLIKKGEFEFEPHLWEHHSAQSKEFVRNMLQVDPDKRFDARKALMSDWIDADDDVLQEIDLSDVLKVFKKFNAKRKFKAAVKAVVAAKKMQLLIDFQKAGLDLNSGEIKALTEHEKQEQAKKAAAKAS